MHIIIEMKLYFPLISTGTKSHYSTSTGFHWNTAKHISLKPIVASCPRTLLNPSEEFLRDFRFLLLTSTINLATLLKGKLLFTSLPIQMDQCPALFISLHSRALVLPELTGKRSLKPFLKGMKGWSKQAKCHLAS